MGPLLFQGGGERNDSAFLKSVGRMLINSGAGHSGNVEWACMLACLFLAV